MKKIINTIKVALMCGYTYWKNPHDFTNQSFEFVGNIMKQIDATAKGVYDCETAQETPFERIEQLKKEFERIEQLKKEIEILKSQKNK